MDMTAAPTASGLLSGVRVATALGWRPVEAIAAGDLVLTFDAGLQPVTRISRKPLYAGGAVPARKFWPMRVPAGALGNRSELQVLPGQYVMIESDAGEELFGDPFSLIKAEALEGVNGIETCAPEAQREAIVLHFEADQVVFDESGVLFYCPSAGGLLDQVTAPAYQALARDETDLLLTIIESDAAAGQVCSPAAYPAEMAMA